MLKFCIPCILSLLVSALYNIVDQIFIGNSELSTLGNAATGEVFPIFSIAQGGAFVNLPALFLCRAERLLASSPLSHGLRPDSRILPSPICEPYSWLTNHLPRRTRINS